MDGVEAVCNPHPLGGPFRTVLALARRDGEFEPRSPQSTQHWDGLRKRTLSVLSHLHITSRVALHRMVKHLAIDTKQRCKHGRKRFTDSVANVLIADRTARQFALDMLGGIHNTAGRVGDRPIEVEYNG